MGRDYVEVYREGVHTPPIGQGFNRDCIATFTNGVDYMKKCSSHRQLLAMLRKVCKRLDCELLSFDVDTLVWKAKIKHFTKLKFEADFNDDNELSEEDRNSEPELVD